MEHLVTNVQATAKNNTIRVQWNSDASPCRESGINYVVRYTLINQCSQVMDNQLHLNTLSKSAMLSNLEYHSTYTVQVTARRNGGEIPSTKATATATTQEAGKLSPLDPLCFASEFRIFQSLILCKKECSFQIV